MVPKEPEAERCVLGAMMESPEAVWAVAHILSPAMFWDKRHGPIYEAIIALESAGKRADWVAVASELATKGQLAEAGGQAYIVGLTAGLPTAVGAAHWAGLVARAARLRAIASAASAITRRALAGTEEPERLATEMAEMAGSLFPRNGSKPLDALLASWYEERAVDTGVPLDLPGLEKFLPRLSAGQVLTLAAYTAVGKTACALHLAMGAAKRGYRTGIATVEMSLDEIAMRLLSHESRVPGNRLRNGLAALSDEEQRRVNRAVGTLSALPLEVVDAAGWTARDVELAARKLLAQKGLQFLVVDYVQLLAPLDRKDTMTEAVAKTSRAVKAMARVLEVPVLAVAQLRRPEGDANKRPELRDLLQSGALERDADAVLLLHWTDRRKTLRRPMEVIVAKNRSGPLGVADVTFDAATGRWEPPYVQPPLS